VREVFLAWVTEVPGRTDVVSGALAAGTALAGLILVFLGVILAAYQGYPAETPDRVLERHRRAVAAVLVVFFLSLLNAALSLIWLATESGEGTLYAAIVSLFFAQLLAVFGVALYATYRVVLR
jgi:hypothetical protein